MEWELLWRKYKDCKNVAEREKIISALCAARNKDILQRWELSLARILYIPGRKDLVMSYFTIYLKSFLRNFAMYKN